MTEDLILYTVAEVAKILKVTERTVYNYIKAGIIPSAKIGKHWRIKALDLINFIETSKVV